MDLMPSRNFQSRAILLGTQRTGCHPITADQNGFTLLEVLMAMVVAGIGLLGLAMLQGTAIQANSHANKYTQATILAQRMIETLNSEYLDPDEITVTNLTIGSAGEDADIDEDGEAGGIFTRTWQVDDYSTFSRLVTVSVTWIDQVHKDADNNPMQRRVDLTTVTRGRGN